MQITELVLKVTSRCNLNCSYCYVFNKGDMSYETEPAIISSNVIDSLLDKVDKHCRQYSIEHFLIIFHGGEPLSLGMDFYRSFIKKANIAVTSTNLQYALQTNGTLLNEEWVELLTKLNIYTCISLDGDEKSMSNRIYKSDNRPSYGDVIRGLKLLQKKQEYTGVLSVANVDEPPQGLYRFFKSLNVYTYDLLFPDATFDKPDKAIGKIGEWLCQYYDAYSADSDSDKPNIRLFELIEGIILGQNIGNEYLGKKTNRVITIKSNGNIEAVDSLKICYNGITQTNINIATNTFDDAEKEELIVLYHNAHDDKNLSEKCRKCIINHLCGGSQLAHRYSEASGFQNPSVYCNDIRKLIMHIQNKLYREVPDLKLLGVDILEPSDFND